MTQLQKTLSRELRLLASCSFVGLLGVMALPQLVHAGVLGQAVLRAEKEGTFVIDVPVQVNGEALGRLAVGARGDASCNSCVAPVLKATFQRPEGMLRISGVVPAGQSYLEFQAWVEWEQDGFAHGDLRSYKIALPAGQGQRNDKEPRERESSAGGLPSSESTASHHVIASNLNTVAPTAEQSDGPNVQATINQLIAGWLSAWSSQNMDLYLAYYAEEFSSSDGLPRSEWEKSRRQKILGKKGKIHVDFDDLSLALISPNTMVARFTQKYHSASYASVGVKSLTLIQRHGDWKIVSEIMESEKPLRP